MDDGIVRGAGLSFDGVYRWWLTRRWAVGPLVHWLMLNPSTADADVDDPTIRRCIAFSRSWGMAGLRVTNLFALRATQPAQLREHPDPVGVLNDAEIQAAAQGSAYTVCAWGGHRMARIRAAGVMLALELAGTTTVALKVSKSGAPWHPLYVRGDQPTTPYRRSSLPAPVRW